MVRARCVERRPAGERAVAPFAAFDEPFALESAKRPGERLRMGLQHTAEAAECDLSVQFLEGDEHAVIEPGRPRRWRALLFRVHRRENDGPRFNPSVTLPPPNTPPGAPRGRAVP